MIDVNFRSITTVAGAEQKMIHDVIAVSYENDTLTFYRDTYHATSSHVEYKIADEASEDIDGFIELLKDIKDDDVEVHLGIDKTCQAYDIPIIDIVVYRNGMMYKGYTIKYLE